MALREALQQIIAEYPTAMTGDFKAHKLADFLRRDFPETVQAVVASASGADDTDYLVVGGPGQGQWGRCPWVAIFDPFVTHSAERGYYPVYLFREDFTGVYLSLNQGVTDVKEEYKSRAKDALRTRAADYRSRLGTNIVPFTDRKIDLRPSSPSNISAEYEAGNIVSAFYDAESIPEEQSLRSDLLAVMRFYDELASSVGEGATSGLEPEEQDNDFIENHAAFRLHRRIERNPALVRRVKEIHGYRCAACNFDFELAYPGIKKNKYIEAHHLVSVSSLKGTRVSRNPKTDFVVLCPNCHRMIHRYPEPGDLVGFCKMLKKTGQ